MSINDNKERYQTKCRQRAVCFVFQKFYSSSVVTNQKNVHLFFFEFKIQVNGASLLDDSFMLKRYYYDQIETNHRKKGQNLY